MSIALLSIIEESLAKAALAEMRQLSGEEKRRKQLQILINKIRLVFFLQPGAVVGFDTEWRPTMCRAGTDERFVRAYNAL